MLVGKKSILLLNVPTVGQQDVAQIAGASAGMDSSCESVFDQQGQVATVVQMRMGQDDSLEISRRLVQGIPVAQSQWFVALKQSAIDQQAFAIRLDAVFGSGHGTGTA
jgi:hypothetical protein